MAEIDTKSIESVQAALSFFGEKNYQRKYRSTGSIVLEEKEFDLMLKDLANYKVQLEVKESAYMQALLKVELYQKEVQELSTQLKNTEVERDMRNEEGRKDRTRIDDLESEIKELSTKLLEGKKVQEELVKALNELTATQEELHNVKSCLVAVEEAKLSLMKQAELIESAANLDKKRTDELLKYVAELNDAILLSNLVSIEAEKEKSMILSEKEAEIQMATAAALQAQEELEEMRKRSDMVQDLENQLLAKSIFIDSLQLELEQAKEVQNSSSKAASDAINDLNQLKSELQLMERETLDKNEKEETDHKSREANALTVEMEKTRSEMNEIKRRESEAQVEIAILKSELHKGRSKIAAAEAAEARAMSIKSGCYLAVQQLAVEAEEAKNEARMLKVEETGSSLPVDLQFVDSSLDQELLRIEELKIDAEDVGRDNCDASLFEKDDELYWVAVTPPNGYELDNLKKGVAVTPLNGYEQDNLKKELEGAFSEIQELRTLVEKAVMRAELAEKAKAAIEDQLRKWREDKQKRRATLAALREDLVPKQSNSFKYDRPPTTYLPLGKVLNMKS